ncbi:MAG: class I SAM-dependent methyltransferase [Polyangiaceae bacterium]
MIQAWETIADAYQDRYQLVPDEIHLGPMCPNAAELGLVPSISGRRVLEVGCGGGQNIVFCALRGASRAIGVDPASAQLGHARRLAETRGARVELFQMGAEQVGELGASFDLVLSVYALMYVADIERAMEQIASTLVTGGEIVLAVDHPMRLSGAWDEQDRFVVGHYFDVGWESWNYDFPEHGIRTEMHRFRRTVSDWVNVMIGAGLELRGLHEPRPPEGREDRFGVVSKYGARDRRNVFSREKLERVPGTLILHGARR